MQPSYRYQLGAALLLALALLNACGSGAPEANRLATQVTPTAFIQDGAQAQPPDDGVDMPGGTAAQRRDSEQGPAQSGARTQPTNSSGSAGSIGTPQMQPIPAPKQNLTADERVEVFLALWETIQNEYVFLEETGVDWAAIKETYLPKVRVARDDTAFHDLLDEVVAALQDGHISLLYPPDMYGFPPVETLQVGNKVIISNAAGEAAAQGFKAGMEIVTVDGRAVAEVWAEREKRRHASTPAARRWWAARILLRGRFGSPVDIRARGLDGEDISGSLPRTTSGQSQPTYTIETLDDGYIYMAWNTFEPNAIDQIYSALTQLADSRPPGVILDLRENRGGFPAPQLLNPLFKEASTIGYSKDYPSGAITPVITEPLDKSYDGPVVLLTSPQCGSSCDLFSSWLDSTGRATLVGQPPAGLGHPLTRQNLPYGYMLNSAGNREHLNVQMEKLEGNPAHVDFLVSPAQEDIADGRDPVLQKAIEVLETQRRSSVVINSR